MRSSIESSSQERDHEQQISDAGFELLPSSSVEASAVDNDCHHNKSGGKGRRPTSTSSSHKKRFAPKTRSGCVRCRARHVKCDEGKPQCQRCISSNHTCTYTPPKTWYFEPRRQSPNDAPIYTKPSTRSICLNVTEYVMQGVMVDKTLQDDCIACSQEVNDIVKNYRIGGGFANGSYATGASLSIANVSQIQAGRPTGS